MNKMAVAFNTTVAALEDELTQLILEGLINARIDSHSKAGLHSDIPVIIYHLVTCNKQQAEFGHCEKPQHKHSLVTAITT